MQPLGIVRKIDELGRVVIPKEVRRTEGWKSGQPLEMFKDNDGSLVIKAYSLGDEDATVRKLEAAKEFTNNLKDKRVLDAAIKILQK